MSRRRRKDTGGFSCFFIPQKRGQIEDMFGLCGQGAGLRMRPFLGRDLARLALRFWANALAGGGFADRGCACTLLPGVWFGLLCAFEPNALGWPVAFQWAGVVRVLFARRLARLALRFWAERMGRAGCGFVGRGVHAPLLARSLACSALLGRTHGAGRWRFNGRGCRLCKGYFSSAGE